MGCLTNRFFCHGQSLLICASAGDTDYVAKLLNRGASIEAKNEDGQTALLVAAKRGHLGVVDILLKNHADVDGTDSTGLGAIHLSSENGQWQMVKLLLKHSKTTGAPTYPLFQITVHMICACAYYENRLRVGFDVMSIYSESHSCYCCHVIFQSLRNLWFG